MVGAPTPLRSAAIAIRPPPSAGSVPVQPKSPAPPETTGNAQKPCRNILIFGQCKFEGKGCIYNHDLDASGQPKAKTVSAQVSPNPPTVGLPPVASTSAGPGVQSAVNAPVFVPKFAISGGSQAATPAAVNTPLPSLSNASRSQTPDFRPGEPNGFRLPPEMPPQHDFAEPDHTGAASHFFSSEPEHHQLPANGSRAQSHTPFDPFPQMPPGGPGLHGHGPPPGPMAGAPFTGGGPPLFDGMGGMDPYYHSGGRDPGHFNRQPLHYHLYAPPLPHTSAHHPHQLALQNFFLSHGIREELQRKSEATWQGLSHGEGLDVNGYFGLYPLDAPSDRPPKEVNGQPGPGIGFFGFRSWAYKAGSEKDGKCYVLRRLEGFRLAQEASLGLVEKWRRLRHPNVVGVREAFTTRAFGDNSIVFVYDYHPLSTTVMDLHLAPKSMAPRANGRLPQPPAPLNERVFWSYCAQLVSAIKAAHTAGLAVRTIEPTKILVTGKNRLRINCCSIFDVTRYDESATAAQQQEDLFDLGKLLVALACGTPSAVHNLPRSLEHIGRQYSQDVQKTILFLFSKPSPRKTIDEVLTILGTRLLDEYNASQNHDDGLEAELMREVENGRLVRLMSKFGFINERPEFDHDPKWAESGERYVIKLFRDYVFHQIDERGRPVVDLSHVLTCLNKLDAGVEERITLVSRDAQTCLVVSYREIKNAVEQAYRDLRGG